MRAEDDLQLPPRDDKGLKKKAEKEEKARAEAREIRQNAE